MPEYDISNRFLNIVILEQPAHAAVARPTFAIRCIDTCQIHGPTGIRFEGVHDYLGSNHRFHHCMNVIRANMRSQDIPASMAAHFANGFQDNHPSTFIEKIRRLIH